MIAILCPKCNTRAEVFHRKMGMCDTCMRSSNEDKCKYTLREIISHFLITAGEDALDKKAMAAMILYRHGDDGGGGVYIDKREPEANFKGISNWYYEVLLKPAIKHFKGK